MAIELRKEGDKHRIDLAKRTDASKPFNSEIIINLDWSKGGSNLLGMIKSALSGGAIDLDLGCFIELRDGSQWCLDGLQFSHGRGGRRDQQTRQGCYTQKPFVWHNGDDRGGSSMSGENISVNPAQIGSIKRMLVYTFIYEGVARWSQTNAVAKVIVPGVETVEVKMGQQTSDRKFCAIASLDFGTDNSITVQKLVTFFNGHDDCARAYGWNFRFTPGTK